MADDKSMTSYTEVQMQEMRGWCEDVFGDMPEDATEAEVVACVERQYEGTQHDGVLGFILDGA